MERRVELGHPSPLPSHPRTSVQWTSILLLRWPASLAPRKISDVDVAAASEGGPSVAGPPAVGPAAGLLLLLLLLLLTGSLSPAERQWQPWAGGPSPSELAGARPWGPLAFSNGKREREGGREGGREGKRERKRKKYI